MVRAVEMVVSRRKENFSGTSIFSVLFSSASLAKSVPTAAEM